MRCPVCGGQKLVKFLRCENPVVFYGYDDNGKMIEVKVNLAMDWCSECKFADVYQEEDAF